MYRRLALAALLLTVLCGWKLRAPQPAPPEEPAPPLAREFRGVWVATVDNIDWPSKPGLPANQQQAELRAILDKAVDLNLNAVVLQVRPGCDALYASRLEPWSEYLTGTQGKAPEPFYDPLAFAVEEAHRRGLELHAWFNPYRARHPSMKGGLAPNHVSRTRPALVKTYGKHLWLDPGEPDVQAHSLAVVRDVVRRYDVDGVHIDDYFYPYKEKDAQGNTLDFPDGPSWERYRKSGGTLARDDWRRENVNTFVRRLYAVVKREKPGVKVGVSPFGIWRPGFPETIKGFDAYAELYADAALWQREGWLDYSAPQLYWPIAQTPQSYPVLLQWWAAAGQNPKGRHVWPGLFTSRVADASPTAWPAGEVANQVQVTRWGFGASGNIHFSARALMRNQGGVSDALKNGPYAEPALVPASPWLASSPPAAPRLRVVSAIGPASARGYRMQEGMAQILKGSNATLLVMRPGGGEAPWLWAVRERRAGGWRSYVVSGRYDAIPVFFYGPEAAEVVAVSAVDRCGNESAPALLDAGAR